MQKVNFDENAVWYAGTDGRQIFVDGKEVHFSSSSDAIAAGLGMVHQHFMQVPSMTVAENLILGAEPEPH